MNSFEDMKDPLFWIIMLGGIFGVNFILTFILTFGMGIRFGPMMGGCIGLIWGWFIQAPVYNMIKGKTEDEG